MTAQRRHSLTKHSGRTWGFRFLAFVSTALVLIISLFTPIAAVADDSEIYDDGVRPAGSVEIPFSVSAPIYHQEQVTHNFIPYALCSNTWNASFNAGEYGALNRDGKYEFIVETVRETGDGQEYSRFETLTVDSSGTFELQASGRRAYDPDRDYIIEPNSNEFPETATHVTEPTHCRDLIPGLYEYHLWTTEPNPLIVSLTMPDEAKFVGDLGRVELKLTNDSDTAITDLSFNSDPESNGLSWDPTVFELTSGPAGGAPSQIAPEQTVTLTYEFERVGSPASSFLTEIEARHLHRNISGDASLDVEKAEDPIKAEFVRADGKPHGVVGLDEIAPIQLKLTNQSGEPVTGISLDFVGTVLPDGFIPTLDLREALAPYPGNNSIRTLPETLGASGASAVGFADLEGEAIREGTAILSARLSAVIDGEPVDIYVSEDWQVRKEPDLQATLTTTADSATQVGEEFDVIATLTNVGEDPISNIKAEPLSVIPLDMISAIGGPRTDSGADPRVSPLTIGGGESATVTWTVRAELPGVAELKAPISGRDPQTGSTFFLSPSISVPIEAPAIEISNLRLQPGDMVPGTFGNIRGTITNTGSLDVSTIDFEIESRPELQVIDEILEDLDPAISPRIALLAKEESREFMIPVGMVSDAGELATYSFVLTMSGKASSKGATLDVTVNERASAALDLTDYHETIKERMRSQLLAGLIDLIDGINEWGDSSTVGGIAVGGGQGVLNALQKMGDGVLSTTDLLGQASGDGGQQLTEDAEAIVAMAREYYHTTSWKEMAIDYADVRDNIAVGGVEIFANWLHDVDVAYTSGDNRRVAELLSEPATQVAVGFGTEKAAGQLFTKVLQSAKARISAKALKRKPAPDVDVDAPGGDVAKVVDSDYADLKDIPTGVAITGQTVARAGMTVEEHGWMIEMAKKHGVAFFVRPRPAQAAQFARMGYNAKPMAIKFKSISDIDQKWLGYDGPNHQQGLVVMREPKDPFPEMKRAVARGDLEWGGDEIDRIIKRYNLRKAEWAAFDETIEQLNADGGFTIQRFGKTIKTQVTRDADGLLRFTHNNQPIYSDIDLLQIARPDGSPIPPELHKKISEAAGFGFDAQHGDTVATSDFPNWKTAKKFAVEYGQEHMRGGDPLVIVQPDVTTLGYVKTISVPEGDIPGSGYDLYSKIGVTYEGAGRR